MSLTKEGMESWDKKLRKDGLNNVRLKVSQGNYNNEGNFVQSFISAWIKNEEGKTIIKPMRLSNIIAISATIISLLSLVANIALTFIRIR